MKNIPLNTAQASAILNTTKAAVLTLVKTGKIKRQEQFRDVVIMFDDLIHYVRNNSLQTTQTGFYENGFIIYQSKIC